MAKSLLDEAIAYCHASLLEIDDGPTRSSLQARLGVLERALWASTVQPTPIHKFVQLARVILLLRAEVADVLAQAQTATNGLQATRSKCA